MFVGGTPFSFFLLATRLDRLEAACSRDSRSRPSTPAGRRPARGTQQREDNSNRRRTHTRRRHQVSSTHRRAQHVGPTVRQRQFEWAPDAPDTPAPGASSPHRLAARAGTDIWHVLFLIASELVPPRSTRTFHPPGPLPPPLLLCSSTPSALLSMEHFSHQRYELQNNQPVPFLSPLVAFIRSFGIPTAGASPAIKRPTSQPAAAPTQATKPTNGQTTEDHQPHLFQPSTWPHVGRSRPCPFKL